MQGQTELTLEALGHRELSAILRALIEQPATEREIQTRLGISQTAATRGLKHLRLVGLVERESPRSAYEPSFRDHTIALFEALAALTQEIAAARADRDAIFDPDHGDGS